jgi:hypothetical protein
MSRFHEKAEGRTKQIVGQMVGDDELIAEGQAQERAAGRDQPAGEESGLQGPLDPPRGNPASNPSPAITNGRRRL